MSSALILASRSAFLTADMHLAVSAKVASLNCVRVTFTSWLWAACDHANEASEEVVKASLAARAAAFKRVLSSALKPA